MFHLTENQVAAIELLAQYKYLTSSQFVRMNLYKQRDYLTKALKPLVDMKKPLIAKHNFNPINGKLESLYYLTKYAKQFLLDEAEYSESQIKLPKGLSPVKLKDYYHRKLTIDFHIYFNEWLTSNGGKMGFLHYYFDKSGNNRTNDKSNYVTTLNKIHIDNANSFIPDINSVFSIDGKKYLYLFEQHNGKDTKRLYEQLYVHIIAISKASVSKKYKLQQSHKVIVVCEEESIKNSIIKRLQKIEGIRPYNDYFFFKTNEELKDDFFNNWTLISGEQTTFLSISRNT